MTIVALGGLSKETKVVEFLLKELMVYVRKVLSNIDNLKELVLDKYIEDHTKALA